MNYTIHYASSPVPPGTDWRHPVWQSAQTLAVDQFRPESSDHRPVTRARLLRGGDGIHGIFHVQDRFVRCVRTGYGGDVWKDACVEFFVEPRPGAGYFSFEFNCGGAFLANHILDPTRTANGFKRFTRVPETLARSLQVRGSLPAVIEPERTESLDWTAQFFIPFALLASFVGPVEQGNGRSWRGNFFKCAEDNSHPHWASWSPVDEFNFHRPACFGELRFE